MKTSWTKGLPKDEATEVEDYYNSSTRLRARLVAILDEKLSASETGSLSASAYESPNWAYKQADSVGYKRALREVISLISS